MPEPNCKKSITDLPINFSGGRIFSDDEDDQLSKESLDVPKINLNFHNEPVF